ncbi:hypothetical protein SLS58_009453, partial [Diplodia intermedia]
MTASPKRKRGPSDPAVPTTQPFAPRLNTTSAFPGPIDARCASASDPHSSAPSALLAAANVESGSESPRSRVANQFERLQIHKGGGSTLPVIDFGSGDAGTNATKKAKHSDSHADSQQSTLQEGGNRLSYQHELSTGTGDCGNASASNRPLRRRNNDSDRRRRDTTITVILTLRKALPLHAPPEPEATTSPVAIPFDPDLRYVIGLPNLRVVILSTPATTV